MNTADFANLTLFITGPTYLRPEVRQAGLLPEFGHRDKENEKRFCPIFADLKKIAGVGADYELIIFNGSGTNAMEASIRSLVADGETVLNVSVGAFGDLYHKLAQVNGKKAVQLKFEPGQTMDLDKLESAMKAHKPAAVSLTHNETSTGVTNDIVGACALVKAHGALPLVDGVSIFGGAPARINESAPAMYVTSTQKALGLPAGFGLAFVSAEALAKAEKVQNRGFTSDILAQLGRAKKHQTLTTPNTTLANQMAVQLDYIVNAEGLEARFKRHAAMRDQVHDWAANQDGFKLFAPSGYRSPTVTSVKVPSGVTQDQLKKLKEVLRGKGYLFDPGYAKLNTALESEGKPLVFRIGHMGDLTPAMLAAYLTDLSAALKHL
jgi:aspartate aminotransferase-like enzyme